MKNKRIMFVGPSGIGKTTLATYLARKYELHFMSGSVSKLIPETERLTHQSMLNRSFKELALEDWKIMNLRNHMFNGLSQFITDRSYVDLAAYYWYKQDKNMPECEMDHFFECCRSLMKEQCDLAIFLPLNLENMNEWEMEDNNKRIQNRYFQVHISSLMGELLAKWEIPTVCINSLDLNERVESMTKPIENLLWEEEG